MSQVKIRTSITAAVALAHASAQAGRFLVPVPEAGLGALSAREVARIAPYATAEVSEDAAWRGNVDALALGSAPASWEAVLAALRAQIAAEDAAVAEAKAKHEARVTALLALDPETVTPEAAQRAMLGELCGHVYYDVREVLLGQKAPVKGVDPRLLGWLERARPAALAAAQRELDGAAEVVRANLDEWLPQWDGRHVCRAVWRNEIQLRDVVPILGAAWTDAVAARQAAQAAEAARVASARKAAQAALLAWAARHDDGVRLGIAEGYDQRGWALVVFDEVLLAALALPGCDAPEVAEDADLAERKNVHAAAVAALDKVRERARQIKDLPEGATLAVGRLSRQTYTFHAEGCDPHGDCVEECGEKRRTVVPVTVMGLPEPRTVLVPIE